MSNAIKKIALIATSVREQQKAMTMVAARLPLSFVETTIKVVSPNSFENSIDKVAFVDVAVCKIEGAL